MDRTNIYLTGQQKRWLDAESAKLGISKSELIRRIIDAWFSKKGENHVRP